MRQRDRPYTRRRSSKETERDRETDPALDEDQVKRLRETERWAEL